MTQEPERLRFRREVDALGFAMIYHVLTLDRDLSDGAFRLYALLLRYARQADGCWPGVPRLAQDLGKGERTISRGLAELEARGIITRARRYGRSSVTWLEDLEAVYHDQLKGGPFEQLCEPATNGTIERPFESAKNGMIDAAKNGRTEEKAEKKKHAAADLSQEQRAALALLLTVPCMDPAGAHLLVEECDLGEVPGWVTEAKKADPAVAAALVVARLKAGEPAPRREAPDRRRFIEGEFAEYIQH